MGCSLHDLIQPSFSFLVGVALPFSLASRLARGQSKAMDDGARVLAVAGPGRSWGFSSGRRHHAQTNFTFEDTLSQIGLGYTFLFLLALLLGARPVDRAGGDPGRLLGGLRALSGFPAGFRLCRRRRAGETGRTISSGFAAHWDKNSNLAWAFDTWFLNLFPREAAVPYNGGGYATLSFIPTLGTMILGLLAGGVLRRGRAGLGEGPLAAAPRA